MSTATTPRTGALADLTPGVWTVDTSHSTVGYGPLYQGRFKSFVIQEDHHAYFIDVAFVYFAHRKRLKTRSFNIMCRV